MVKSSIIAVPTGLITANLFTQRIVENTKICCNCLYEHHDDDARFCKKCGAELKV